MYVYFYMNELTVLSTVELVHRRRKDAHRLGLGDTLHASKRTSGVESKTIQKKAKSNDNGTVNNSSSSSQWHCDNLFMPNTVADPLGSFF